MKRRDFLKKGTMVAGLASSSTLVLPAIAKETAQQKPSQDSRPTEAASEEIRSAEYLRHARANESLPKAPVKVESHGLDGVRISPMPLEETATARDCAAAGLLQHRSCGRCASHLWQWADQH